MLRRRLLATCRGLAVAVLLMSVAGCGSDTQRAPVPPVGSAELIGGEQFIPFQPIAGVDTHPVAVGDLEVGDCLESPLSGEDDLTFRGVDCVQAHTTEVFAIVDRSELLSGPYPGEAQAMNLFQAACRDTYQEEFGVMSQEHQLGLAILAPPDAEFWNTGDGWIACGVFPLHLHAEEGGIMERYQQRE